MAAGLSYAAVVAHPDDDAYGTAGTVALIGLIVDCRPVADRIVAGLQQHRSHQWSLALVPAVLLFFVWELGKVIARRSTNRSHHEPRSARMTNAAGKRARDRQGSGVRDDRGCHRISTRFVRVSGIRPPSIPDPPPPDVPPAPS